jgi:hypothetical protein
MLPICFPIRVFIGEAGKQKCKKPLILLGGKEVVRQNSEISGLQKGEGEMAPLKSNGYFQRRPHLKKSVRGIAPTGLAEERT